jgi:transposase-like protein
LKKFALKMMKYKMKTTEELEEIYRELVEKRSTVCLRCKGPARMQKNKLDSCICLNKVCKNRYSLWQGTCFHGKKIDLLIVLRVLEMFMIMAPNRVISYVTGLSKIAIWRILREVSKILVPRYYSATEVIGGNDVIVQVDESKFGKRKYHKGHHVDGVWILGMIEKTEKRRIKLVMVDDRSSETIMQKLKESVQQNSIIHSDCWRGYNPVQSSFKAHQTVNHSKYFKDPVTGVNTNTIEGEWSGIKVNVPAKGRTKDKINLYLVRYMLIRNESLHPLDAIIKHLF